MTNAVAPKENKAELKQEEGRPFFYSFQQEMNRLFDEFRRDFGTRQTWPEPFSEFHTKLDVKDCEKQIEVTAELPGVEAKDIELTFNKGNLVLKGEKKSEKEESDKNYYRMERRYGSFYRVIPLPTEVQEDKAEATFKNGVLKITLPKNHEATKSERKIEIKG